MANSPAAEGVEVTREDSSSVPSPTVNKAEYSSRPAADTTTKDPKVGSALLDRASSQVEAVTSSSAIAPVEKAPPLPTEAPPLPTEAPPLPAEAPPLPTEAPLLPAEALPQEDDGWEARWDDTYSTWLFFNRFTGVSQWENPRAPEATQAVAYSRHSAPGLDSAFGSDAASSQPDRPHYNPAIHGSYDPEADYAKADAEEAAVREREADVQAAIAAGADPAAAYAATGRFNRFTGKWQRADLNPENFNDDAKSTRQQRAFFDVEAAANAHDGRSLRAERANKKLTGKEVKAFKEKRRAKKEEKRRAWLRD